MKLRVDVYSDVIISDKCFIPGKITMQVEKYHLHSGYKSALPGAMVLCGCVHFKIQSPKTEESFASHNPGVMLGPVLHTTPRGFSVCHRSE